MNSLMLMPGARAGFARSRPLATSARVTRCRWHATADALDGALKKRGEQVIHGVAFERLVAEAAGGLKIRCAAARRSREERCGKLTPRGTGWK